jgi:hypothetical protein
MGILLGGGSVHGAISMTARYEDEPDLQVGVIAAVPRHRSMSPLGKIHRAFHTGEDDLVPTKE